jgi:acetoin utilization deacetylase AcuC-like enzyme/ankyrin repeat protein
MAAAPSSEDEEFLYESANIGSHRYPVHDCCEFEDAESLRRLIFVPQDASDDDSSSGSDDSDEPMNDSDAADDSSSSSSSDDNDSTDAAHAAAIGHSPHPPAGVSGAAAPLGATAEVAAGMGANTAPGVDDEVAQSQESDGDTGASAQKNGEANVEEAADGVKSSKNADENKNAEKNTGAEGAPPSPPTESAEAKEQTSEGDTPNDPMDASPDKPGAAGTSMESPDKQVFVPRISVSLSASMVAKKAKKKSKKPKRITYYCPYDLNERDPDEITPLHVAIHARKLECVKLLLEAGASVHKKNDGSAPIHTAISIGAIPEHACFAYECIQVLASFDADLSVKDDSMHTPLYLACAANLAQVVTFILSDSVGLSTLNTRADRSGGRALHAVAKFESSPSSSSPVSGDQGRSTGGHHHPDGTVLHSGKRIPELRETTGKFGSVNSKTRISSSVHEPSVVVTQLLLTTTGIEIDALNSVGQTPLHVACARGNWSVVRLLLEAGASSKVKDRRGMTPGQVALKRGMPIPNDLLPSLGDPVASTNGAPPRDLIVDPDCPTLLICHELCMLHRTCPPIRRDSAEEAPPENVRRLHVLLNPADGILKGGEFGRLVWDGKARRASMVDILKVHEYNYVELISRACLSIPDHPQSVAHLDPDTTISRWSFEAALRAAGSVCDAVDRVIAGDYRNAFCSVRPPGHHAGPRGIVKCANDMEGSHGFCLLNNVAIGAAYARSMYRNDGIRKIAIIDFDVHHGNGTEEVIRQLVPNVETTIIRTPFSEGTLNQPRYRPWLDETDVNDVFFASTHGYGPRTLEYGVTPPQGGWFYPASGPTHTSDAILNPHAVETPNLSDFILSQSWTRLGEDSRANCCKIIDCGLSLPEPDAIPGMQRLELRDTYRKKILPCLRDFDPDMIFISAGFDAHKKDTMNHGYVGMVEDDYEWVTEQLVKIANTCCNGRIVSVLEGGYKIHGGIVSPFARSVASHVRALVDGGRSRELYDSEDCNWESQFERHVVEDRERKRQQRQEKLLRAAEQAQRQLYNRVAAEQQKSAEGAADDLMNEPLKEGPVIPMEAQTEEPSRKRRRNNVDYRELYEQMKKEGFASG